MQNFQNCSLFRFEGNVSCSHRRSGGKLSSETAHATETVMEVTDDSSDDEVVSFLIANELLPGLATPSTNHGSRVGKKLTNRSDFDGALSPLETDYLGLSPWYGEGLF